MPLEALDVADCSADQHCYDKRLDAKCPIAVASEHCDEQRDSEHANVQHHGRECVASLEGVSSCERDGDERANDRQDDRSDMRDAARSKHAEGCVVLILNVGSALFPLRPPLPQAHDRDFYPTIRGESFDRMGG